jgi:hypothetical protein
MQINILTKAQIRKLVKESIDREMKLIYLEINRLRGKYIDLNSIIKSRY